MITVSVALSSEGVIEELLAEGHAGFGIRGTDIVCSAFTVLLRTFARTIEASPGVAWSVLADEADRFHLVVKGVNPDAAAQYRGWCEFMLRGFEDLAGDEPRRIRIEYGRFSGRLFHGS
jgi:uncharacterized protein YsxB (DUF464 family)